MQASQNFTPNTETPVFPWYDHKIGVAFVLKNDPFPDPFPITQSETDTSHDILHSESDYFSQSSKENTMWHFMIKYNIICVLLPVSSVSPVSPGYIKY